MNYRVMQSYALAFLLVIVISSIISPFASATSAIDFRSSSREVFVTQLNEFILYKEMINRLYHSMPSDLIDHELHIEIEYLLNISRSDLEVMSSTEVENILERAIVIYNVLSKKYVEYIRRNTTVDLERIILNNIVKYIDKTAHEVLHEHIINITVYINKGNYSKVIEVLREISVRVKSMHIMKFSQKIKIMANKHMGLLSNVSDIDEAIKLVNESIARLNKSITILKSLSTELSKENVSIDIIKSMEISITNIVEARNLLVKVHHILVMYKSMNVSKTINTTNIVEKVFNSTLLRITEKLRELERNMAKIKVRIKSHKHMEILKTIENNITILNNLIRELEKALYENNITKALEIMVKIDILLKHTESKSKVLIKESLGDKYLINELYNEIMDVNKTLHEIKISIERYRLGSLMSFYKSIENKLEHVLELWIKLNKSIESMSSEEISDIVEEIKQAISSIEDEISTLKDMVEEAIDNIKELYSSLHDYTSELNEYEKEINELYQEVLDLNISSIMSILVELNNTLYRAREIVIEINQSIESGSYSKAFSLLKELEKLVSIIKEKIEHVREEIKHAREHRGQLNELVNKLRREINSLEKKISTLKERALEINSSDALKLLNEAEQLVNESKNLLENAIECIEDNDYSKASQLLEQASSLIEEAKDLIKEAEELLKEHEHELSNKLMKEINEIESKVYELNNTLNGLEKQALNTNNSDALKLIEEARAILYNVSRLVEKARNALEEGNYTLTKTYIEEAKKYLSMVEELIEEIKDLIKERPKPPRH